MKNMKQVIDGITVIHYADPCRGSDYTLCGIGCEETEHDATMTDTSKGVNCQDCHDLILAVRKLSLPKGNLIQPPSRY